MSGAQSAGKRLAVPARQLALKPNLQILRRPRRPLLRGLEQARRSTLADHVHRPSQLDPWVLINESWYKAAVCYVRSTSTPAVPCAQTADIRRPPTKRQIDSK